MNYLHILPNPRPLFFLIYTNSFIQGVLSSVSFMVENQCEFTVWPAISSNSGSRQIPSGFALESGENRTITMPPMWQGRVWGRTHCIHNLTTGNFSCVTGDCGTGNVECANYFGRPPVTLVEFGLGESDFYDISLLDGYNLPTLVAPFGGSGSSCIDSRCVLDLNEECPFALQEVSGGNIVGCQSACQVFKTQQYCCNGNALCSETDFSRAFKTACPNAIAYPRDDGNSTFSCNGADYSIMFCPSFMDGRGERPKPFPPQTPSRTSPTSSQALSPSAVISLPPIQHPPPSTIGKRNHTRTIILVVVSATVLFILGIAYFFIRKTKQGKKKKILKELLTLEGYSETHGLRSRDCGNDNLRLFTYESIISATNNFSADNKLGDGGFGSVYKGKMPEGQDIAVKLLSRQSGQGLLEFKNELTLISRLQHVNLVKLFGLCIHGEDKMIIYDYMPNKSLDFFLFSPSGRELLNWQQRLNVIEGTAQGLLYLHKYSRLKIIHRDLKPSNILLDENMNPKISDFGLARVFEQNMEQVNTNRRVGTYGYMAPEYAMQGILSVKLDVYSFGVLVLEIVSGRRNNSFHEIEGPLNLVEYAWELWKNESVVELMDPTLRTSCDINQLQRCIHISLLCVENRPIDRPTIEDVLLMLKSEKRMLVPKNPSFIARNHMVKEVKRAHLTKSSNNELTVSDIGGR